MYTCVCVGGGGVKGYVIMLGRVDYVTILTGY